MSGIPPHAAPPATATHPKELPAGVGDQNPPSAWSTTSDIKGIHTPEQVSMSLLLILYIPLVPEITVSSLLSNSS